MSFFIGVEVGSPLQRIIAPYMEACLSTLFHEFRRLSHEFRRFSVNFDAFRMNFDAFRMNFDECLTLLHF